MKQIVLINGMNYFFGNIHFKRNEPKAVNDDVADKLLRVVTTTDKNYFVPYTKETANSIESDKKGTILRERGDITAAEITNKTQVAGDVTSGDAHKVTKEAVSDIDNPLSDEDKKSADYTISEAVALMKKITELQSLLDFTAGDTRKGVTNSLEGLMDKMGPSGAGNSGEEAVIV